jgi:hypothetical protein
MAMLHTLAGCSMAMLHTLAGGSPARVTASHRPGIEPCRYVGNNMSEA